MIIAVDGPAGAGKSTASRLLAKKLGFLYIDTGAMYRALTLKAIRKNLDVNDAACIIAMARNTLVDLKNEHDGAVKVLLDNNDVTSLIRQPGITQLVSDIARIKEVREVMLEVQRRLGRDRDSVLDGRDIGTVVFPDADKKFYIDADSDERVRRRYKELKESGQDISLKDVQADLRNRDTIDSTRECAPLKKAEDAIYVDTTKMSIEKVVDTLLGYIQGPEAQIENG